MHHIVPLDSVASRLSPIAGEGPRAERMAYIAEAKVALPPIEFGHTDLKDRTIVENPGAGSWAATEYHAHGRAVTLIRDAVVRSPTGIITIDDIVLSETLTQVPPVDLGGRRESSHIDFDPNPAERDAGRAVHLLAPGHANYYHWMTDVVARALLSEAIGWEAVPIFGVFTTRFQPRTIDLLGSSFIRRFGLPPGVSLRCRELVYVPELTGYGFSPHPCVLPAFDRMRSAIGPFKKPWRRLFIARSDRARRPLRNETQIAALLTSHGFVSVHLETLTLDEQIRHFAEAECIIAPHGAGLANLLFCQPGTIVIELMPSHYVNWSMRRIAAVRGGLRYGCLVGQSEPVENPDPTWPHDTGWTLSLEDVAALFPAETPPGSHGTQTIP